MTTVKKLISKTSFALVGVALLLIPAAPALAATSSQSISSGPMTGYRIQRLGSSSALTQSASENWAGYAATGGDNNFTSVSSTWIEPTVTCSANQNSDSAFWVGLDGFSDQTVEQIGTEANCNGSRAQYYIWYEMYPQNPSEVITGLSVLPGNSVTATVTYNPPITTVTTSRHGYRTTVSNPTFTLTLMNHTTGLSYSTTQISNRGANRSSAEVIAEAPYDRGILPLADFGVINYATSTVNGAPLGKAIGVQSITMEDPSGMVATPSSLDPSDEDFSVTWSN